MFGDILGNDYDVDSDQTHITAFFDPDRTSKSKGSSNIFEDTSKQMTFNKDFSLDPKGWNHFGKKTKSKPKSTINITSTKQKKLTQYDDFNVHKDKMQKYYNKLQNMETKDLIKLYNKAFHKNASAAWLKNYTKGRTKDIKDIIIDLFMNDAKLHNNRIRSNWEESPTENKPGMSEISKILLNMEREIKFTKKASTPDGAEELVMKHNSSANDNNQWHLNLIDPNQPTDWNNFRDENGNGKPDIVIYNAKNQPIYINGYTTRTSSKIRKIEKQTSGMSKLMNYFKKMILKHKDEALKQNGIEDIKGTQKLALLNKAASKLWNEVIIDPYI